MNQQTQSANWLDRRRDQGRHALQRMGQKLEKQMMAAQWRSAGADLLSFAFEPLWNAHQCPARIEQVEQQETATSVWLRPAQRWNWPKAGQFVTVTAEHNGEKLSRCYSISALDREQDLIRLTICKVAEGHFSSNVAPAFKAGDVLQLSQAGGNFVSPADAAPLYLCAAGSGVTPMLPLAEVALTQGKAVRLMVLSSGVTPLLWSDWLRLQRRFPSLLTCEHWDTAQRGRPQASDLEKRFEMLPSDAHVYTCGPEGFRELIQRAAIAAEIPAPRMHVESFYSQVSAPLTLSDSDSVVAQVSLGDGRQIAVREGETILQAAKNAGVAMQHCCGQGVCRSCETRKVSGVVQNLQTGLKQLREGEWILPCISLPLGNVELAV